MAEMAHDGEVVRDEQVRDARTVLDVLDRLLTLGPTVDVRLVAEPPTASSLNQKIGCDLLHAQVLDGNDWVTIASVDGRYLSSDLTESFTGRVVGPYAKSGVIDVLSIDYRGQDVQR